MNRHLEARKERYYALSSRFAHVDNGQLSSLLGNKVPEQGWGGTQTIKMDTSNVFVKCIPVTDLEYDNMFSTANLYSLPAFYNYGVGSAGFGAFRELITHIKTTNWVLEGSIANFPLMYHYRVMPFHGARLELDIERHNRYVEYWNGNKNIDRYIRDRSSARYEIILFVEHFPNVLYPWLAKNLDRSDSIIREMRQTIAFLRGKGIIHFDAHFHNILVDEGIPYLTDFGLVLDKNFTLDAPEKNFFRRHIDYDYAEFLACLGSYLQFLYKQLSPNAQRKVEHRFRISEDIDASGRVSSDRLFAFLLENIEEIYSTGLMKLDDFFVAEVIRHYDLIVSMNEFYSRIQKNNRKDTPYPYTKIRRLFKETELR